MAATNKLKQPNLPEKDWVFDYSESNVITICMAKKATSEDQVSKFEDIPNIGPSIASDLRSIGITNPKQLLKLDPYKLYLKLCNETNQYHDPCVLDVFLSAKHFMSGNKSLAWWTFTEERKANFSIIRNSLEKKFKS